KPSGGSHGRCQFARPQISNLLQQPLGIWLARGEIVGLRICQGLAMRIALAKIKPVVFDRLA
ncbi:MAG: hypothetical protein ACM3JB_03350, partial [Acidobacteriaceae bacterium]